jgi:DNA-binding XRE family transcriptional regulator
MPTLSLSLRIPADRHALVRAVVERLKAADGAGDPSFPTALSTLVTTHILPAEIDRLTAIERRLSAVEDALDAQRSEATGTRDLTLVAFGAEVRRVRTARRLRQRDLAAAVHLNERTIREVEKAKGGNPNTRRRLAEHLGMMGPGVSVMTNDGAASRPRPLSHGDATDQEVTHTD